MNYFSLKERVALVKIHFDLSDKDISRMLGISTRTLYNVVNDVGYSSPKHREHLLALLSRFEREW